MTTYTITTQPGVGGYQITSQDPTEHHGQPVNATAVLVPGKASFALRSDLVDAVTARGYNVRADGTITR